MKKPENSQRTGGCRLRDGGRTGGSPFLKELRICRIRGRSGMTLVELVVSMLLTSMIMAMIVGILSPAAKTFLRLQKLQYAWQVLDNTAAELRSTAGEAAEYVKIYENAEAAAGAGGKSSGSVLEFVNPEGYVTLLLADGSPAMDLMLENTKFDTAEAVPAGRLTARYYNPDPTGRYICQKDGKPVARAAASIFTDGFYMGNYLQMKFTFPAEAASEGDAVTYLEAELSLYNHADRLPEHLVAQETVILDFRYLVVRKDAVTAVTAAGG